jgi:transposase
LRDYTRLRTDLTHDRSRQVQRLEKLLEDALIKISAVATDIMGVSGRAMIKALIAGQRDPKVLAGLARGRMKPKHSALVAALDGRFDDHHAELARILLDQIDALTTRIDALTARFCDLGPDYHTRRIDLERRIRNHVAQLAALGYRVSVEPAA